MTGLTEVGCKVRECSHNKKGVCEEEGISIVTRGTLFGRGIEMYCENCDADLREDWDA